MKTHKRWAAESESVPPRGVAWEPFILSERSQLERHPAFDEDSHPLSRSRPFSSLYTAPKKHYHEDSYIYDR